MRIIYEREEIEQILCEHAAKNHPDIVGDEEEQLEVEWDGSEYTPYGGCAIYIKGVK